VTRRKEKGMQRKGAVRKVVGLGTAKKKANLPRKVGGGLAQGLTAGGGSGGGLGVRDVVL